MTSKRRPPAKVQSRGGVGSDQATASEALDDIEPPEAYQLPLALTPADPTVKSLNAMLRSVGLKVSIGSIQVVKGGQPPAP